VDEFWVCAHCRSLNRAGTGKCYSCREKYGSQPKADAASKAVKPAPAPPPLPQNRIPDFSGTPMPAPTPAPYYSRPVALASGGAAAGVVAAPRPAAHFPSPVGAIRGRVGRMLAMHQSVPVGWLGYLTSILLFVVLVVGAIVAMTVMPVATYLLQHGHLGEAWAQLNVGQQGLIRSGLMVAAAVGLLTLLCFSAFLGLSTHNATGLGADQPMLTPYAAATCWFGVLWSQVRIAVGLIVPAMLLWKGYVIPGLVAGLVALEIAHRHVEGEGGWLARPYQHVPDLYAKLGLEGSISSPMAWIWSSCFRIANGLVIAVSAIPLLAFVLLVASAMTDRPDLLGWHSNGLGLGQIAAALLVICMLVCTAVSIALLIPITLGLVQRQRTRRTLVRVGRSRSWAAKPGEVGRNHLLQSGPRQLGGEYDEDRIVERGPALGAAPAPVPGGFDSTGQGMGGSIFGAPAGGGPGTGGPGMGGPGFGAPRSNPLVPDADDQLIGGPGFGAPRSAGFGDPGFGGPGAGGPGARGPGQASLYSPSTTSSPPWSEDPSADPD
jgi:hypothetical protein